MKFLTGALAALLYVFLVSVSQAQISQQLAQKAPEAATIAAIAEQNGFVRVIVEFSSPVPPSEMRPDSTFLAPIKERIAALQDSIIASHFGSAANPSPGQGFPRAILRFDITPGFAVNVSQAELDSLAADSQVVRINYDRASPPVLLQSVPLVGMPNSYADGATGLGQAVAVIDTGVDSDHEFLAGKVLMEACFSNSGGGGNAVTLCPNGLSSQTGTGAADPDTTQCLNGLTNLCEHGTHVAGIAAGNNTNPTAVANGAPAIGVAKSAKLVAVQVFTRFNDNTNCNNAPPCVLSFTSDMVSALNWVFQNALTPAAGVKLASANMSIGGGLFSGTCDSDSRKAPIDNLLGAGVVTAIAAGNNGSSTQVSAPGCISSAVTVASSDKNDVISSFSNMSSVVDLMAPGGFGGGACMFGGNNADILSSVAHSPPNADFYACLAGTSMATPHVAGSFAAIRSACPNATAAQILTALQNTGLSITDNRIAGGQTKPRIRVALAVQQLGCSNGPRTATHEFNDDSKSDVLWRNTNGGIAMWLMNSGTVGASLGVGNVPTDWSIVGQRDFDADGFADILWRNTNGGVAMWLMTGNVIKSSLGVGNLPTNWAIVGTGDFNGDGKGDILWRDTTSGGIVMQLMNGGTIISSLGVGNLPLNWVVAGTGDFNGDGKWDILWHDTASGGVVVQLMDGATTVASLGVGNLPTNWAIAGTGDFNGDGKRDILWRDNNSGGVVMWLMDGGTIISSLGVGNLPTNWVIPLTGDFNGDGMSDILWRDNNSGGVAMWLMNGAIVSSSLGVGNVPTDWQIQGTNAD